MANPEINNIVHAGVVFLVYGALMMCLYFFLSAPIDAIMNGLIANPPPLASSEMAQHGPNIAWGIKLAFACGLATPATWFIFWVFSKEPFVGYKKRY